MKKANAILAVLWSMCLILNIVLMASGESPTWFSTLAPIVTIVCLEWLEFIRG
jgi:hypothetical protein